MKIALALLIACVLQACAGRPAKPDDLKACTVEQKWDVSPWDDCPTPKENPK